MAATWSTAPALQPPSYEEAAIGHGLTFLDFLPVCNQPGGLFTSPKFETFQSLIDNANDWLRKNPAWEVRTCESVEFKTKGDNVNYEKMTYMQHGKYTTRYIRGLRLWIVPRLYTNQEGQQIGYINLVPQAIDEGGLFSMPTFESLPNVIERFNSVAQSNPIPGRIITVETQEMRLSSRGEVDPDRSTWREDGERTLSYVFVIRIFFEITVPALELIGLIDFYPEKLSHGGIFSSPKFEPFANVVQKASSWCAGQRLIKFCNAQTLEIKLKSDGSVDSHRMRYADRGNVATCYVRILRVAYVKFPVNFDEGPTQPALSQLTCKTFVPKQVASGFLCPEFETLNETKNRVKAWMEATGARVISAETAAFRLTGDDANRGVGSSFTRDDSRHNEYMIFVIRLYLNGHYIEPPSSMLPPSRQLNDQDCCTII